MSDINIVIGAKNEASKILDDVGQSTQRLGKNIMGLEKTTQQSAAGMILNFKNLSAAGAALTAAIGAVKGVGALGDFLFGSVDAFNEAEESVRKLTTAIKLSGADAAKSIGGHVALSDELERQLNIEAEVTQGLMAQASMMGVADDQLDAVAKTAIGLSEAMGVSLEDGLKKARLATEGNFESFNKLIPSLKDMTTDEEKLAAVLALSEKGLIQKSEAAGSAAQADERAALAFGQLSESIGAALAPIQALVYEGLNVLVTSITSAFGPAISGAGDSFTAFKDAVTNGAKMLAEGVVLYVTFLEVEWGNIGRIFWTAVDVARLALETMRANIQHTFTQVIPTYAMWFADNFVNILSDAANAALTVVKNMASNIQNAISLIWKFVSGDISGADLMAQMGAMAGKSLLDGFKSSVDDLPAVMERETTALERQLQDNISQTASDLSSQFNDLYTKRMEAIRQVFETTPIETKVDLKIDKTAIEKDVADATKAIKPAAKELAAIKTGSINVDRQTLQASESRLLTRGEVTAAPMETVAENTAATRQTIESIGATMANIAPALSAIIPSFGVANSLLTSLVKKDPIRMEAVA